MTDQIYRLVEEKTALGTAVCPMGPGMPRFMSVHLMQPMCEWATKMVDDGMRVRAQDTILYWLTRAFEAGRRAKAAELREALGWRVGDILRAKGWIP
jgi:hypothetical protein